MKFGGYGKENSKHYIVLMVDLFRRRMLDIGKDFLNNNRLDHTNQIFDLLIDDIDQALDNEMLDLRGLIRERSSLINRIKQSRLVARVVDSRGRIYHPPRQKTRAGEMLGVPISPGIARGRVKIFHSYDQKKLMPGEILVARATDPGWTPLFINAAGIILEVGGALQHGAAVAREYGVPCVSGVDEATMRFKDGQMVELDGSNGVISIIERDKAFKHH